MKRINEELFNGSINVTQNNQSLTYTNSIFDGKTFTLEITHGVNSQTYEVTDFVDGENIFDIGTNKITITNSSVDKTFQIKGNGTFTITLKIIKTSVYPKVENLYSSKYRENLTTNPEYSYGTIEMFRVSINYPKFSYTIKTYDVVWNYELKSAIGTPINITGNFVKVDLLDNTYLTFDARTFYSESYKGDPRFVKIKYFNSAGGREDIRTIISSVNCSVSFSYGEKEKQATTYKEFNKEIDSKIILDDVTSSTITKISGWQDINFSGVDLETFTNGSEIYTTDRIKVKLNNFITWASQTNTEDTIEFDIDYNDLINNTPKNYEYDFLIKDRDGAIGSYQTTVRFNVQYDVVTQIFTVQYIYSSPSTAPDSKYILKFFNLTLTALKLVGGY